jgi:hypothetical protein
MLLNSPKQFESVLQVANRNTEFIDSPAMQRCLEASDFDLAGLKTSREGMSLYLCLPQRYMSTHYRWLRMMIALTVTEMEIVRGRPATGFPILMVLDEFAGLKRMEVIEHAVAQVAGYGVKLFFVLQSLEQLKAVYKDNWETFLSNSGLKIFFSIDDHFSRDYISKLVGETEVIREVRSESKSDTESESVSHSIGSSTSRGRSVSDGTNWSSSDSESRGVNSSHTRSKGRSSGDSWTPKGFFGFTEANRQRSRGRNSSWSDTEGTSRGSSRSQTDGGSHGTSESYSYTENETDSVTRGTSSSRTMGASETIHRRALVAPDEIGLFFARINDAGQVGYPGLALVVISGERTIALRRVNYYEDYQFIGIFEPHPDFPGKLKFREVCVDSQPLEPWIAYLTFGNESKLKVHEWLARPGQIVGAGEPVASVTAFDYHIGYIKSPRNGMIAALPGADQKDGIPRGALFSMKHFEGEENKCDPFEDIVAYCRNHYAVMKGKVVHLRIKIAIVSAIALVAAGLFAANDVAGGAIIPFGIGAAILFQWFKKLANSQGVIRQYPDESSRAPVRELPSGRAGQLAQPLLSAPAQLEPVQTAAISAVAPVAEPPVPDSANIETEDPVPFHPSSISVAPYSPETPALPDQERRRERFNKNKP